MAPEDGWIKRMLDGLISAGLACAFMALGIVAHSKMGTYRKADQRPHTLPWGLILIGCVFGLFLILVHVMNLIGVETGPENNPFWRS